MTCTDEMLATAGIVRSAVRVKSGSAPPAPAAAPGAVSAGGAGFCAPTSLVSRMRAVMTRPATNPQASSRTDRTSRRALMLRNRDAARGGFSRFRTRDGQHAVAQVRADGLDVYRQ